MDRRDNPVDFPVAQIAHDGVQIGPAPIDRRPTHPGGTGDVGEAGLAATLTQDLFPRGIEHACSEFIAGRVSIIGRRVPQTVITN